MKVDSINLLTKLAGIVGITGTSICFGMAVGANEVVNPNPAIAQEAPYSRSQRIQVNAQYTSSESSPQGTKSNKPSKKIIAQATSGKPSIFDECPYNRAACGTTPPGVTPPVPTPAPIPTPPDVTVPTIPTPGTQTPPTSPTTTTEDKDVVALAESNPSFSTLAKALKAAGLVETLQGKGPFTIFAPTNEAFAKLPQDAVQDLFKPENKEVLVKILTYHVVSGNVESGQLKAGDIKSLQGDPIKVKIDSDKKEVMVNDAKVTQTDIKGNNGIIHSIDNVIIPPSL
ncbi:MAG: fasciclin domain-containing protein [Calothrix sp. MO_167.B12]|nr:fasciclin domain-containing protein [Calothrix sp. MO_167.B12]